MMSELYLELPTDVYMREGDRFVTVAYRSDYDGGWRTCLRVDGTYVLSTDRAHRTEQKARMTATLETGIDNGRGAEVQGAAEIAWCEEVSP